MEYKIEIPGPPMAQGRPRFSTRSGRPIAYEKKESKSSKAHIQQTALSQLPDSFVRFEGAIAIRIIAKFACPKSKHRKRIPVPASWKSNGPDVDNIAKHYMDALLASGLLADDDRQVASLQVLKIQAAQGEPPCTIIEIIAME
jgi:Holliday junction resolvase RusA-like endonuclease